MLSKTQLKSGFHKNELALEKATSNQLFNIFKTVVPVNDQVDHIIEIPKSAIEYRVEYINIGLPFNATILNNLFFILTSDAHGLKYVSENLRKGQLGAKLSLFSSPGMDRGQATVAKKQYTGMLPIMINYKGSETATLTIRGTGLSSLAGVDVLITGHMINRNQLGGGFIDNI